MQKRQQLSALDTVFLSIESPDTPTHIGGLALLDPSTHPEDGFGFESFCELVADRLRLCPRMAWSVQEVPFGLDRPYWVEGRPLDVDRHLHAVTVPAPGGSHELAKLAGLLFSRPLPRNQPLWEMIYIDGLQGGRVAVLWKIHHCLMDGVSGASLIEMLFDLDPTPAESPLFPVDEEARAGGAVSTLGWGVRALRNAARRPAAVYRHLSGAASQLARARAEGLQARPAPRTPTNGRVGGRRSVAWSLVSFERIQALKRVLGVTVNDVVLALTSGAVRGYLEAREALPEQSLIAAVPVSGRQPGDTAMGNQVSEMLIDWATDCADPIERLARIHAATTRAKAREVTDRFDMLGALSECVTPGVASLLVGVGARYADRMPLPANAVVSSVPVSPIPIYLAGARIESIVPLSILPPSQGLNITVLTYCGELHFGVTADPELVDSAWEIADAFPKALVQLEEAAAMRVVLAAEDAA